MQKKNGKGRQPKIYVEDKGIALELAQTIGDKQESKSKEKIDRHHSQVAAQNQSSHKPRRSSKAKLKEVVDALKADRARAKREKSKARKQHEALKKSAEGQDSNGASTANSHPARKRVSFA